MEDISGKKFSLQDWVMRRAANQSGGIVPPLAVRQNVSMADEEEGIAQAQSSRHEVRIEDARIETDMRAVSNGASVPSSGPSFDTPRTYETNTTPSPTEVRSMDAAHKIDEKEEKATTHTDTIKTTMSFQAPQTSLQQLQIVRLLTDLSDRLRQSEKEREVLWKELDTCRKQIADMEGRGEKSDKAFTTIEGRVKEREDLIRDIQAQQKQLEEKLAAQNAAFENSRGGQDKLQEKITAIETATGSAIVRVEDVVAENARLSKRVEALGQDKARLLHKLEMMEETLTQTQDSLKAKALVLLTDQALASRTNLPQTPAWTGNDTLKVSRPQTTEEAKPNNAAVDIGASLPKAANIFSLNNILLFTVVLLGVFGGIFISKMNISKKQNQEIVAPSQPSSQSDVTPATHDKASAPANDQESVMAQIANMANKIEPGGLKAGDDKAQASANGNDMVVADAVTSEAIETAKKEEDKAVAAFQSASLNGTIDDRIARDKYLPKAVKDIETKAFAGDAESQHDMAVIYTSGQAGVKINYNKGIKWFEESAHNGVANAQYNLAVLYHQGLGTKKDLAQAIQLYRVAASNGHPEAQYNLAIAYIDGVGAESDPQVARLYFERAAEGGVAEAAYNLGLLHENGLLGESQPDEAVFWYSLAAAKGNPDAQKSLEQLKSQLSMNDDDVKHLVTRIAKQKPAFLNADGEAMLPEPKNMRPKQAEEEHHVADAPAAAKMNALASAPVASVLRKAPQNPQSAIISQVEEQLARLNLYMGLPDGKMSSRLENAIKAYQKENGLTVDGKPSEDLLVRLLASGAQETKSAAQ